MRKQYHIWPNGEGLDAWDVDHLIELARGLEVRSIPISSLKDLDSSYWFGHGEVATVRALIEHMRLVQDVDTSYPIILAGDGRVMDGMHRVARAMLHGKETIEAVRFQETPPPDYHNCVVEDLSYTGDP